MFVDIYNKYIIMATEKQKELKEEIRLTADLNKEIKDLMKMADEMTKKTYFGKNAKLAKKVTSEIKKDFQEIYKNADKSAGRISLPFRGISKIAGKLSSVFDNKKVEEAQKKYKERVTLIARQQKAGQIGAPKAAVKQFGAFGKGILGIVGSLKIVTKLVSKLKNINFGGAILGLVKKFVDTIVAIDNGVASIAKTSGVLDNSLNRVLIEATENAVLLGGNVAQAAEFANSLFKELSPAIPLTGKLLGNVAQVGERFQFSSDEAAQFLRIVAQAGNTTFEQASNQIEGIVDGFGKLGPAAIKNLVQSYDAVTDSFALGLDLLKEQTLQATQLGISLSKAAQVSEKLLDFQTSVSNEFTASALAGRQINLQKARQLAFEKDIVGATNAVLDEVEKLGPLQQKNPFVQKAVAEAAGLTVSELQKELRIRREIGVLGKVESATRETALGRVEAITRRIQNAFFRVLASPTVQQAFNNLADKIEGFLKSGGLDKIVSKLSDFIDGFGRLLGGGGISTQVSIAGFNVPIGVGGGGGGRAGNRLPTGNEDTSVNDVIITRQGEVVKTNPLDYIMATTNPQSIVSSPSNDRMMQEMFSLLTDLKNNGIKATTYLDGKQVSRQIATMNRY